MSKSLIIAASRENPDLNEINKLLQKKDLNIDEVGLGGFTALHSAVELGHVDIVETLANAKADADIPNELGLTALHSAAQRGKILIINALLRAKANVHARTNWGDTPLHFAAENAHDTATLALLRAGADIKAINANGNTPLLFIQANLAKDPLNVSKASAVAPAVSSAVAPKL